MIAAVDIGGTKIAVGMVDDAGKVWSRAEAPTEAGRGYRAGLGKISQLLRTVSEGAGQAMHGIGHFPFAENPKRFAEYLLPILAELKS